MNPEVKVFELLIDDATGVEAVALVDTPAIERNWMAFNKAEHAFKIQNEERRIVSGPLMVADLPIFRVTPTGEEYYVIFRKPTIEKIAKKFMREGKTSAVNLMHNNKQVPEDVWFFNMFLIDSTMGIKTPKGFEELPDGSWFGSAQVDNDELWQEIKAGRFRGFSVEGQFIPSDKGEKPKDFIERVIEIING